MKPHKYKKLEKGKPGLTGICECGRPYEDDIHAFDETVSGMTQEKENWRERYRDLLPKYASEPADYEAMEDLISQLLIAEREASFKEGYSKCENEMSGKEPRAYGQQQAYAKVREVARELKLKMNVDEYLPKVEAWNKSNYDVPFDDGYEQAKADLLKEIESLAKEGV